MGKNKIAVGVVSDCMNTDYDVIVAGAGPIGGFVAGQLAKKGFSVLALEEHEGVGRPVHCAGLVTPRVFDIVDFAKGSIISQVKGARVHSPLGQGMEIGGDFSRAVVIDRARFDQLIMDEAVKSGAELRCNSRITGMYKENKAWSIDFKEAGAKKAVSASMVIGADGADSKIRDWLGLPAPKFMLNGFEAEVTGIDIDRDKVEIFVGNEIAPKFFAWLIPAGERTRVGLCVRGTKEPVYKYFKNLFGKGFSQKYLAGAKIELTAAGKIPIGLLPRTYSDGAMLVGDAASQVKATSGGGIYTGLVCARHCSGVASEALAEKNLSKKFLATYQKRWMAEIGGELKNCMLLHNVYASMTDKQFEDAFELLARDDLVEIINKLGDIDYPSKVCWALLKKEPRLLKFAGKFIRSGLRR
jgi:digeranylgeranylglycerophospholipid reductase